MSRFFTIASVSFFLVIFLNSIRPVLAQQVEEETLAKPVTVSHEDGIYKGINSIPASIRQTKPFARMLHELQHYAGFNGTDNSAARLEAFEQAKSDLIRDASISDKVSGSKLSVFSNAWTNVGPVNVAGCTKAMAFDPADGNIIYA